MAADITASLALLQSLLARIARMLSGRADRIAQPHSRHPVNLGKRPRHDQIRIFPDPINHAPVCGIIGEVEVGLVNQHHALWQELGP